MGCGHRLKTYATCRCYLVLSYFQMTNSRFHLDPPSGFCGFDPRKLISCYERNLPHWRQEGATYAVTFRLVDSLPQNKLNELKALRTEFELKLKTAVCESAKDGIRRELVHQSIRKTEAWLDQGMGDCVLRTAKNREILREALFYFNDERYGIGAFVIMPNHVHILLRPYDGFDLGKILHSIKRESSRNINLEMERSGSLWQDESHDRIVRDCQHLWRCLQYIGTNPEKSGLGCGEKLRWVSEKWQACGWDFVGNGI